MRRLFAAVIAVLVAAAVLAVAACTRNQTFVYYPTYYGTDGGADAAARKLGGIVQPTATNYQYTAGTSGSVVVPALAYVSGMAACSSAGGTITVAPVGSMPDGAVLDGSVAGATITLPAGSCWSMPNPAPGYLFNLGPNTTVTFTGTSTYYVQYASFGSF
jgi:hypothetical protein